MVSLHTLQAPKGSRHRKKRVGRGQGSGLGKTAGRGGKGQKARTGNMRFEGFEGGQSPLQRRLPKFGFTPPRPCDFAVVNLAELEANFAAKAVIDEEKLRAVGLVKGRWDGVKVLGDGKLSRAFTVRVHRFSKKARAAIEAVGGVVEEVPLRVHPPEGDPAKS